VEAYQELEQRWAEFNSLNPAGMVACASGTAALHLAFEAFQLPSYSEVICPDFTMVACPRAIVLAGLTPVFVDCGDDLNLDLALIKPDFPGNPAKAILAVHIYGRQCDVEGIHGLGKTHGRLVIEDLAEAHGIRPHDLSHAACWSFYKNKIVAGEEGGAVWFKEPSLAKLARLLRSQGFTEAHDFSHVPRGHNYRLSNLHAAYILGQGHLGETNHGSLKRVEQNLYLRRLMESWHDSYCLPEWRMPPRVVPWVYDLRISGLTDRLRDHLIQSLKGEGIAARHAFKPMTWQKEFSGCRLIKGEDHKAGRLAREIVYLPISPGNITEATVKRAYRLIRRLLRVGGELW